MYRRVRLISGLILFAYVTTHLLNHALGIVSIAAMEQGRSWFLGLWRNPAGTTVVLGALLVHLGLVLWSLYRRHRLDLTAGEAVQLLFGIAVPLLLLEHVIGTRGSHELAGTNDSYAFVLLVHWKLDPRLIPVQTAGLLAAWVHGCLGVCYWLRLKPVFVRAAPYLLSGAILLPVLALIGYADAGREVLRLARDPAWLDAVMADARPPDAAVAAGLLAAVDWGRAAVVALVLATLGGRLVRQWVERRRGVVRVTYPGGQMVSVAPGPTLLEVSRRHGVPHASVCGGRGRCSTCRVRVTAGAEGLAPPGPEERRVLERIGGPVSVRLACQIQPRGDLAVVPLLPPTATARDGFARAAQLAGREREVAILFADLRAFTRFSETRLPYDVVFVLNRYFAHMGGAVEEAGGHLDKFIGDGVMALFGIDGDGDAADASRRALAAARSMCLQLAELNRTLAGELAEPLRMGIGLHLGHAIVGEMGYGAATSVTAVGDAVNTASRLEAASKAFGAELVVSEDLARRAGADLSAFPRHEVELRGRSERVSARVVAEGRLLPI